MPTAPERFIMRIVFLTGFFYCLGGPLLAQTSHYRVRSETCLNLRARPSSNAEVVTCLTPGTVVTVIQSVPFWREILVDNNLRGWVAKKFIEPLDTTPYQVPLSIPDNALLTIHFVDVGQGDAIWIQTYDDGIDGNGIFEGYSIIIDGGPYSADASNPLLSYLESKGHHGADIEALLITHPHTDHFNGATSIAKHFNINHYYDPGYPSKLPTYTKFLNAMKGSAATPGRSKAVHLGKANFGKMDWGKELQVEVLYAWNGDPQNILGSGNTEINNASVVLRVQYGDHSFLFMGDAEGKDRDDNPDTPKYIERILLDSVPRRLKSTVLKIAHHGSETSSSLPFIEAVDPDIVIVQSGRKAFSGTYLPDLSTLRRYCAHNPAVEIYRTDEADEAAGHTTRSAVDGDHIILRSNGRGKPQVVALEGGLLFRPRFCDN